MHRAYSPLPILRGEYAPVYIIRWFEIYYPNVTLNRDYVTFSPQCMNVIQGKKPSWRQWNILLDVVVN